MMQEVVAMIDKIVAMVYEMVAKQFLGYCYVGGCYDIQVGFSGVGDSCY